MCITIACKNIYPESMCIAHLELLATLRNTDCKSVHFAIFYISYT